MKGPATTATLSLLLALASGQALASDARPMPTFGAAPFPRALGAETPRPVAPARGTFRSGRNDALPATQQIRERALQGLLAGQEPVFEETRGDGRLNLRFQRRGNAFKDMQGGYREMCNRVSAKIWDEPNGKRVRFDVAGKPGVGVEIPLGRAKR